MAKKTQSKKSDMKPQKCKGGKCVNADHQKFMDDYDSLTDNNKRRPSGDANMFGKSC